MKKLIIKEASIIILANIMSTENLILVEVMGLVEEGLGVSSMVILHEKATNRVLPIVIGEPESRNILISLNQIKTPRPLTHQLIPLVINQLKGKLEKVVIDRLEHNTFYASLHVRQGTEMVLIDARPSDAVSLALEVKAPIYADLTIMEKAGHPNPFTQPIPSEQSDRPSGPRPIKKAELSPDELNKLKELLEKARQREETGN